MYLNTHCDIYPNKITPFRQIKPHFSTAIMTRKCRDFRNRTELVKMSRIFKNRIMRDTQGYLAIL